MPEPEGELGEPDLPDLPDLENEQGNLLGGVDNKTIKPFNLFTLDSRCLFTKNWPHLKLGADFFGFKTFPPM